MQLHRGPERFRRGDRQRALWLYDLEPASSSVRNISTRGQVGTGEDVMIGGPIVAGTQPAKVMIRAIGPSLTAAGVSGALADPILELHSTDGSIIYENDNWRAEQAQQILDSSIPPSDERESAIIASLPPGVYTAIVRGAGNSTGVALVEIYALDPKTRGGLSPNEIASAPLRRSRAPCMGESKRLAAGGRLLPVTRFAAAATSARE